MTSPRELVADLERAYGLNQRGVADLLQVAPSTVTRWKRGIAPRSETARVLHALAGHAPAADHPLRQARLDAGLTLAQLAAAVPTSPTAISHWEAGRRRPSEAARARLVHLLGVSQADVEAWFGQSPLRRDLAVPGLVHVRRQRGWSQRDVARRVGRSAAFVQRLESTRRRLDERELSDLCEALELGPDERELLSTPVMRVAATVDTRAARLRRSRRLSLGLAASRARVSPARLRAMEQGRVPVQLGVARRLASAYGVRLETVLSCFGQELPEGLVPGSWQSMSLPAALRLLRLCSGLRWQDLSALTGRSESTLRRWHAGDRVPDAAGIRLLELAYGLDVGRLACLL